MFFLGDPHFRHIKVARIRGFDTVEEHDAHLIKQIRNQVRENDRLIIMGDISSGREEGEYEALEILRDLPGYKTLICGNHDSVAGIHRKWSPHTPFFQEVFETIHDYGRIRMEGRQVLLSHYPYISQGDGPARGPSRYEWARLSDTGELLIHAHTHHTDPFSGSVTGREMCVSWDARRNLTTEAQVSAWVKSFS